MKIIIPMAGLGSRLRPHTLTVPKPLTIIAGKPIVQRLVENINAIVEEPIEEIAFIVGTTAKGFPADIEQKLMGIAKESNAKGSVFIQEESLGTAHAIYCAKEVLQGPCIVAFADTLFRADFSLDTHYDGAIWVKQVSDPSAFGVVKLKDGIITNFVEKPKNFVSDLAIIGIYYFKNGAELRWEIEHLLNNNIKEKGEYQITNVLESLKNKGAKFIPNKVITWMDCGRKEEIINTNKQVLTLEQQEGNDLVSDSVIVENSQIIQPCYVGEGVRLKNTKIGPYVSIGNNSVVENSIIVNSLIQDDVRISNANLNRAMIGNNVKYNEEYTSISIGDYTELI